MLSCLPAAQICCCSGHSLAAPSCRRLLSRSLTSAETSHCSYWNLWSAHTDMPANLAFWGKKREPAFGRVSCSCLLGAGRSSPGVTGVSPAWVCWAPWSESWMFTDCLAENTCWPWAAPSPGQMLVGLLKNMGEVESRREVEQFVSVHKLLRPDATTALSFYEMWWRGVLLPVWQELRSQWHCDHRHCSQILLLSHSFTGKDLGLTFDTELLPPKAVALFQFIVQQRGSLWGRRFPAAVIN